MIGLGFEPRAQLTPVLELLGVFLSEDMALLALDEDEIGHWEDSIDTDDISQNLYHGGQDTRQTPPLQVSLGETSC